MGIGKEVSYNVLKLLCLFVCLLAFVKTSLCGKFKTFKTNKAVLTIVIKRKESDNDENILRKYFSPKEKKSFRSLFGTDIWLWFVLFGAKD